MANNQFENIQGNTLYDSNGEKIGKIKELYFDENSEAPTWATVSSGIFGTQQHFMPLEGVIRHEDGLMAPFAKDTILGAPHISAGDNMGESDEALLQSHYSKRSDTNRASSVADQQTSDHSHGEKQADQVEHGTGKLRLRKYIVTETQQVEVPVQREVVEVVPQSDSPDSNHEPSRDRTRTEPAFGEVRNPASEDEVTD